MSKFYFATSIQHFAEILYHKQLTPITLADASSGILFTEDRKYWIEKIEAQNDKDNIEDYAYAVNIELEIDTSFFTSLMANANTGRFSDKVAAYHKRVNKNISVKKLDVTDTNVLCLLDVYESDETSDNISQLWLLKVSNTESKLWIDFTNNIIKMSCPGGLDGATELATKIAATL
jgi:hypothetical protein